jgi:hypothetical protein
MMARLWPLALGAAMLLASCARPPPAVLPAQYEPPSVRPKPPQQQAAARRRTRNAAPVPPASVCRLHVGPLQDRRTDSQSLGEIGGRPVRAVDVMGWVRSGLLSLDRDGAITLVEPAGKGDLDISADLLKSYVMSMPTSKVADIVLAVHFARDGEKTEDRIYRGSDQSMNWATGEGETQRALNRALADALTQIRADVLARCAARASG